MEKGSIMIGLGTIGNSTTGGGKDAPPADGQAAAFNSAARGSDPGLTVSGNVIDTGRYVITGSNQYTRPNDGIKADDGMVSVMDKTTSTSVDVFGDPHVYTSDGDRAEFQRDGLRINLADGTQVQFKPTAQVDGFSHLDSVSVTKGGQTASESGFYSADGSAKVSTTAVQQGAGAAPYDPNTTVMSTAPGGGLNTLVNAAGAQLSSKSYQTSLDGMGGGNVAGSVSPELVAQLQKLIGLLQQMMGAASGGAAASGGFVSGNAGQSTEAASVQRLIGLLQAKLEVAPAPADQVSPIVAQVVALLEKLLGQQQPTAAPATDQFTSLLQQVVQDLQQLVQRQPATAAPASSAPATADPVSTVPVASSTTSAGSGPNAMQITNTQHHAIQVGKFVNGGSTTTPSTELMLQPGQTGTLNYANGEAGFAAQADASGKYQPTASRLEFEADKDGKMKFPDISYIDGRNASISLTDGAGLNKGDSKSIAASAPGSLVTTDSAGNKAIAGWYDGSSAQMRAGGAFMQAQLGTSGAYLHPNDDTLSKGDNPMSGTQSATIKASFGNA